MYYLPFFDGCPQATKNLHYGKVRFLVHAQNLFVKPKDRTFKEFRQKFTVPEKQHWLHIFIRKTKRWKEFIKF